MNTRDTRNTNHDDHGNHTVVIVTGLSGSGISTTLRTFEDAGFEAVDNLPARLIGIVVEARTRPMVIALDVRNRDFDSQSTQYILQSLKNALGSSLVVLFIDCDDDELLQRYSKTKRAHPMANEARMIDGITREREVLAPLLLLADYRLDTSGQNIWQHRERLLGLEIGIVQEMRIRVVSFSYGRGIPRDADLVFDVRFLRNPFYIPELRERNGIDAEVTNYVTGDDSYPAFLEALNRLLDVTLDRYRAEGKTYLTLAFGCTGGQHRSVALAEIMAEKLRTQQHHLVQLFHRELS